MAEGTYTGDPATDPRDALRFLLGDVGPDSFILSDLELDYLIATTPTALAAAYTAADRVAAYYATRADKTVGNLRISYDRQHDRYINLAARLRLEAGVKFAPALSAPVAGGLGPTYLGPTDDRMSVDDLIPFFGDGSDGEDDNDL
jgi:hypothetical protein